MFFQKNTKKNR